MRTCADWARRGHSALAAACLLACAPAHAQQAETRNDPKPVTDLSKASEDEIAKESENPIGSLTVLPFENYVNLGFGPNKGTQDVLEFEPVVPIHVNQDWNVITRAIIPVTWDPSLLPAPSVPQALAPSTFSAVLAPRTPTNGWIWGVGPIAQIPTETSLTVGSNVWGLGPTAIFVHTGTHIVAGLLINNVWSFGGTSGPGGSRYAQFLAQPLFNYNFGQGWFMSTAPIITDNEVGHGQKWTVPVGVEGGRIIRVLGNLPVKLSVGGYYNIVTPEYGARWTLKSVVAVIF